MYGREVRGGGKAKLELQEKSFKKLYLKAKFFLRIREIEAIFERFCACQLGAQMGYCTVVRETTF